MLRNSHPAQYGEHCVLLCFDVCLLLFSEVKKEHNDGWVGGHVLKELGVETMYLHYTV